MLYGGFSLERLRSLSKQKAHLLSGALLVSLAVGIQIYPIFYGLEDWLILVDRREAALYTAIGSGFVVVVAVYWLNCLLCNRTERGAKRMVLKNRLERALKQNPIGRVYWSSAIEGAESLLNLKRRTNESVADFLRRLAKDLRVPPPSELNIESEQLVKMPEFSPGAKAPLAEA